MSITASSMERNVAKLANAGAVYVLLVDRARGVLNSSSLSLNKAAVTGGACVLDVRNGSILMVQNLTANNNTAVGGDAGAMQLVVVGNSTAASLLGCSFVNNTAAGNGGAALVQGHCGSKINVTGGSLRGNQAGGSGGATYIVYRCEGYGQQPAAACSDDSAAYLSSLQLEDNRAGKMGGVAFLASSSSANLDNLTMDNNEAGVAGGSLAALNCTFLTISKSIINGSRAASRGGGVYVDGCGCLLLQQVNVTSNSAGTAGGGLYVAGLPTGFAGQSQLLTDAIKSKTSKAFLTTGGSACTVMVLHRTVVSDNAVLGSNCIADSNSISGLDDYGSTSGKGGGLFVNGSVAGAISNSDFTFGNTASFGAVLASDQACRSFNGSQANISSVST